ncbi:phosphoinositide phosphatase SAC8-like isoform X4 [Pyrus communis]|uniref:phosphoinositide phosphatase SAC8-like isoform X4 n=1 Tax=Pyrus communis TaxID=23211 RepID=UPI0035C0043A
MWTRMWRRGANLDGDVANFFETEQLVEIEGFQPSLLQSNVVEHHFFDLSQRYGETMAIDLTDKHGDEGQLSTAFSAEMQNLPNMRFYTSGSQSHLKSKCNESVISD